MAEGWIKLSRQLQEHWLWKEEPFDKARAFIDLIMLANWEDKKTPYKGEIVLCKRGDVNLSVAYLAKRWRWDRKTVRRFLGLLEADGMVTTKIDKHRTTITIVNYGKYQDYGTTEGATEAPTRSQPSHITKKEKKDKKVKKFIPNKFQPSLEQEYNFEELERVLNEN